MDPEVWKMAATSFKIMNHQKGIFAPKMLQVNRGKYVSTERLLKKQTNALSEEPVRVEDRTIHANGKANCTSGFRSGDQAEMIKICVPQRKTIYKSSVDKWVDQVSDPKVYRKGFALTSSLESQNMTKLPSAVEHKRLPILVRDRGRTFIPQRQDRSAVLFRQDGRTNGGEVKHLVPNHCSKTKTARISLVHKEPLYQGVEGIRCQNAGTQRGIPFNYSNKRVFLKNNISHHGDTSDPCKRIKISDDMTSVRGVGRMCPKMINHQQLAHRQMPTASGALAYSNNTASVTRKTVANGMQRDKCRSSPPDERKGGTANFKEKAEGSSTHRRFLLIDSQGLPYTVFIEEPISVGLSKSTSTSVSDRALSGVSKSVAPRKVYKCPVCFRIFEYLSYLQRHSIAHSQQKPHVCKVCGKAFKRTSHLTRHKYTHFGGKPCHCQICHRRFRDVGELARHQQTHHTGDKNH
ncbi:zinc finger protein 892-like [Eleutherodactylus coqui]|uniref:zinc finger protein 892-like n=1 Tax=Eleutherodactylus coqui TaxID=57060 RepID=UPI0034627598